MSVITSLLGENKDNYSNKYLNLLRTFKKKIALNNIETMKRQIMKCTHTTYGYK